jgi:hypothetical protein
MTVNSLNTLTKAILTISTQLLLTQNTPGHFSNVHLEHGLFFVLAFAAKRKFAGV